MNTARIAFVLPLLLLGCTFEAEKGVGEADGPVGQVEEALASENAMLPNALVPNALVPNALVPNALVPNALVPNALPASALTSLRDAGAAGTYSRMLLKYLTSCALDSSQSFSFTWIDDQSVPHDVTYPGSLGLAPDWGSRGLTKEEQRWVSACVGARTNFYGVTVVISMRGTNAVATADSAERIAYDVQEGAFWGNIFDEVPWVHSCYIPNNVDHARALHRDCAAGHLVGGVTTDCGILDRVDSCSSVCTDRTIPADDPDDGFESCESVEEVLSTYLAH